MSGLDGKMEEQENEESLNQQAIKNSLADDLKAVKKNILAPFYWPRQYLDSVLMRLGKIKPMT